MNFQEQAITIQQIEVEIFDIFAHSKDSKLLNYKWMSPKTHSGGRWYWGSFRARDMENAY